MEGQGREAICEVKKMRRKGTRMHCQSQPGQQGPGLALTQLALSGVGGSCEGVLLTACSLGEQRKTKSMKCKWLVATGESQGE